MFGNGGASLRLEDQLTLLAVLTRLAALLSRADRRIDIRTVLSIVSFWWSGKYVFKSWLINSLGGLPPLNSLIFDFDCESDRMGASPHPCDAALPALFLNRG